MKISANIYIGTVLGDPVVKHPSAHGANEGIRNLGKRESEAGNKAVQI